VNGRGGREKLRRGWKKMGSVRGKEREEAVEKGRRGKKSDEEGEGLRREEGKRRVEEVRRKRGKG
jgi:hypothetical protein